MYKHKGFTAIELAVVMVVIGLLLVVGMVSFRSAQPDARDKERQSDIASLANYLESLYAQEIKNGSNTVIKPAGAYPALPGASGHTGVNDPDFKSMIAGAGKRTLAYPGGGSIVIPTVNNSASFIECQTWKSCYNQSDPTAAAVGVNNFMYRPETSVFSNGNKYVCSSTATDGQVPTGACRSFEIFYVLEDSPTTLLKIESKRR